MDIDLRIPVTAQQKQIIQDAVADAPEGFAAWARQVLLQAAERRLARPRRKEASSP